MTGEGKMNWTDQKILYCLMKKKTELPASEIGDIIDEDPRVVSSRIGYHLEPSYVESIREYTDAVNRKLYRWNGVPLPWWLMENMEGEVDV